jgi:predicted ATPase
MESMNPVFIKRIVLRNYKSIANCSVNLGPLNFLVGPNGAGKSNFLDALRLVSESLNTSLEHALRDRGGIGEVRRRSSGHPTHFGIRLEFQLPDGSSGHYSFRVGALEKGGFEVQQEQCFIYGLLSNEKYYIRKDDVITKSSIEPMPHPVSDRLFLISASGFKEFRPFYDALSRMGFYNFNPDEIRELQQPDPGEVLRRDGGNLASVLKALEKEKAPTKKKIVEFLSKVVPGVVGVECKHAGRKETLEFRQIVGANDAPWRFMAENMSDGTLRALGVLTALFQSGRTDVKRVPLVGIEEPEVAVHPGAAGVLRDALKSASAQTQVLVTSHSPDLLDDKSIGDECILAVMNYNGETKIGPVDETGRSAIRDQLYTAGELLKLGQLRPDIESIDKIPPSQMELFTQGKP